MKSINFPWNPPLLARHPFPLLLLTSLLATRVKTEKFTISKKQGSYFGNRILFILVHIYLDFLKTSYASNYFWDSEYFWDIFIRYFLNFFYGPPLSPAMAAICHCHVAVSLSLRLFVSCSSTDITDCSAASVLT